MRGKVILIAFAGAVAILAPVIYLHFKPANPPPAVEQPAVADTEAAPTPGVPSILKRIQARPQEGLPARPPEADTSGMDHDTYVAQRKAQLMEMGMTDDPANLKVILSELENPEPSIRQTALNATLDFGSKDAIPTLENELNWATDPQEKVDIQKAIDFLQLPHLGDDSDSVTQQSAASPAPASN